VSLCLHSGLDRTRGFGSRSRGLVLVGLEHVHDIWADSDGSATSPCFSRFASPYSLPCFAYSKPTVTAERHTSSHGAPVPSTRSDTGSNRHSHYPGGAPGTGAPAGMDDRSMMTIGEESDDVELRLAIEASRAV
jgi:hypothetical protein